MDDKDIKDYHKLMDKLKKQKDVTADDKDKKIQQEQRDLDESYQQSKRNKKEHSDKT